MQFTAHQRYRFAAVFLPGRRWVAASRAVGLYFAAAAVFNAVFVLPKARQIMGRFRDDAWLPPYRAAVGALVPAAPAAISAVVAFEAVVAYHLVREIRVSGALRWAQAWVLGLIPVLAWPYWVPNAVSAVAFEVIRRRVSEPGHS